MAAGVVASIELWVDGSCKFSIGLSRTTLPLAKEAGCHLAIWGGSGAPATAEDAIEVLHQARSVLIARPEHFKALIPGHGCDAFEDLDRFIVTYEWACNLWPLAKIRYLNSPEIEAVSTDA